MDRPRHHLRTSSGPGGEDRLIDMNSQHAILVTGGAGYIGSSIANMLIDRGTEVVVIDDLSTGRAEFIPRARLHVGDIGDAAFMQRVLREHPNIGVVIHCAAKIVVPESVRMPLEYYENNVAKTITLLQQLRAHGVERFIFSSTASLYDVHDGSEADESTPVAPQSPYSRSKLFVEHVLRDASEASDLRCLILRYFNPIGADPQLRSGHPAADPSHVLGKLVSATLKGTPFRLTGTQWPTRDGSAVRDYVDVWDLAAAHVAAIDRFDDVMASEESGGRPVVVINLGTGRGVTVRELVDAYLRISGAQLEVIPSPPRDGDVVGAYASNARAATLLGWQPQRGLETSIPVALQWAQIRTRLLGQDAAA